MKLRLKRRSQQLRNKVKSEKKFGLEPKVGSSFRGLFQMIDQANTAMEEQIISPINQVTFSSIITPLDVKHLLAETLTSLH